MVTNKESKLNVSMKLWKIKGRKLSNNGGQKQGVYYVRKKLKAYIDC